jgi:diacylglycerol O-acyltransferase
MTSRKKAHPAPQPSTSRESKRMRASDAVFWYAEELSPGLRSTIGGVLILDGPPDWEKYRRETASAMRRTPRLREKIVDPPMRFMLPEWVEDEHMDLDYHMRREALPAPGDEKMLFEMVSQIMATPLDRARPPWESYMIEGLEGGRAANLFKMHHSMVDGVGSVSLLETLSEKGPRSRQRGAPLPPPRAREEAPRWLFEKVIDEGGEIVRDALETARTTFDFAKEIALHPFRTAAKAASTARSAYGLLEDLGKKPIADPITEGASGLGRRIDPLFVSLADLRRVHNALNATINDLVLTAVSGAVGRYHALRGVPMESMRAMVPVNLRQDHQRGELGNRVGMINVTLPVGEDDARRRLSLIQRRTGRAKGDRRGAMYPYFMRLVTALPTFAFRAFIESTAGSVNLICTNIPGTDEPRWLAGRKIEALIPIAPVMEKCPLAIALFSYVDKLGIGIATDPEAIPDHEKMKAHLEDAFEEVLHLDGRRAGPRRKSRTRKA